MSPRRTIAVDRDAGPHPCPGQSAGGELDNCDTECSIKRAPSSTNSGSCGPCKFSIRIAFERRLVFAAVPCSLCALLALLTDKCLPFRLRQVSKGHHIAISFASCPSCPCRFPTKERCATCCGQTPTTVMVGESRREEQDTRSVRISPSNIITPTACC